MIFLCIGGLFIYSKITAVKENWASYLDRIAKRQEYLLTIKSGFGYGGVIHNFKNLVLRGPQKYREKFEADYNIIEGALKNYSSLKNLSETERQSLLVIHGTLNKYKNAVSVSEALHAKKETIEVIDKAVKIDDSPALKSFDVLNEEYRKLTSQRNELMSASIGAALIVMIITVSATLVAVIFINFIVGKSVTAPISDVVAMLKDIATGEGDLTKRLNLRQKDEIGELSRWFDTFVEKIHDIVVKIHRTAFNVASASEEIAASIQQVSATSAEMAKGAETQLSAEKNRTLP